MSRQSPQPTAEKMPGVVGLDSAPKKKETMRVPPSGDMNSTARNIADTHGKLVPEQNREQLPIPGLGTGMKNTSMS